MAGPGAGRPRQAELWATQQPDPRPRGLDVVAESVRALLKAARRLRELEAWAVGDAHSAIADARANCESDAHAVSLTRTGEVRRAARKERTASQRATRDQVRVGADGISRIVRGGT